MKAFLSSQLQVGIRGAAQLAGLSAAVILLAGCGSSNVAAPSASPNASGPQSAPKIVSVTVLGPTLMGPGESFRPRAVLRADDGTTSDATATTVWQSSNLNVATVDNTSVRALSPGQTELQASYQGMTGKAILRVFAPSDIFRFSFAFFCCADIPDASMALGETSQLIARVVLSDHTSFDVSSQPTWASTNSSAVNVSPSGQIVAAGRGTAQVSATYQNHIARINITVN